MIYYHENNSYFYIGKVIVFLFTSDNKSLVTISFRCSGDNPKCLIRYTDTSKF